MPRFLLEKDNHIQVLIGAFFIMLIIIPGLVYINFGDTTIKDEGGVLLENKRHYGSTLNENLIPKNMPQILAGSIEYQKMGSKDKKVKEILKKLSENDQIKELLPKTVSRKTRDMNLLPMLIILGHLLRDENVYHPALKQSLQQILKTSSAHCLMM